MSQSIISGAAASRPGFLLLATGAVFPAGVIGFELATRFCAETFFDPLATTWHVVVVAAVPLINLALWIRLRRGGLPSPWWRVAGGGGAAGAVLFLLLFLSPPPPSPVSLPFSPPGVRVSLPAA